MPLAGAQSCQLIEVEPGLPETFVFGPEAMRYKIKILKSRTCDRREVS